MSKKYDSLGDRMKGYENIARNYLTRRIPTIIRVDGKAFHTFTRGMEKPFDRILMTTMQNTMKYLCENIQGCVFGYTQSDEITLVLTDYATGNLHDVAKQILDDEVVILLRQYGTTLAPGRMGDESRVPKWLLVLAADRIEELKNARTKQ